MKPAFNCTNQDASGIRYGVINGSNLPDWVWNEIEYRYPNPADCGHSEICSCGHEININKDTDWLDTVTCEYCGNEIELEIPDIEPIELYINKPDLQLSYDSNSNIAMIFKSSNIINCRLCSLCYPNAGNLDQIDSDGYATYGLPE